MPEHAEAGRPVPAALRAPAERSLGQSFADVRLHDADLGLHARAFTRGTHVTLGRGVDLASADGRRVLAHELTHVAQQRGAAAPSLGRVPSDAPTEREARAHAEEVARGVPVAVSGGQPLAVACDDDWVTAVRHAVRDRVRAASGEALGRVEGVVLEAATAADTVIYAGTRLSQGIDRAVGEVGARAGLTPDQTDAARDVLHTLVGTSGFRALDRSVAADSPYRDRLTGTVSLSTGVTRGFDALDRGREAVVGRSDNPEYGLLTARQVGVLEGAIGTQVALALVGGEEVQLVLRGVAAVGAIQAIERAVRAHPDDWLHDRDFWLAVGQAVLFLLGLAASSAGNRLLEIIADLGSGVLSTAGPVLNLAHDYREYHAADREQRLQADISAVVRAVAQAIITIVNHARRAAPGPTRPAAPEAQSAPATPRTPAADPATTTPAAAQRPAPAEASPTPTAPPAAVSPVPATEQPGVTPIGRGRNYPRSAQSRRNDEILAARASTRANEPVALPAEQAAPAEVAQPLALASGAERMSAGASPDRPVASAATRGPSRIAPVTPTPSAAAGRTSTAATGPTRTAAAPAEPRSGAAALNERLAGATRPQRANVIAREGLGSEAAATRAATTAKVQAGSAGRRAEADRQHADALEIQRGVAADERATAGDRRAADELVAETGQRAREAARADDRATREAVAAGDARGRIGALENEVQALTEALQRAQLPGSRGERLTMAQIDAARARIPELRNRLADANRRLRVEIAGLDQSIAAQVRAASPTRAALPAAVSNAARTPGLVEPASGLPVDVTTGRPMTAEQLARAQVDHVMSRAEIAADPRFARLDPAQREHMLLGIEENHLPATPEANNNKSDYTVDEWIERRAATEPIPPEMQTALRAADVRARAAVEAAFRSFLGPP